MFPLSFDARLEEKQPCPDTDPRTRIRFPGHPRSPIPLNLLPRFQRPTPLMGATARLRGIRKSPVSVNPLAEDWLQNRPRPKIAGPGHAVDHGVGFGKEGIDLRQRGTDESLVRP